MLSPEVRRQVQSAYTSTIKSFLRSHPFSGNGNRYELHEGSLYIFLEVWDDGLSGGYDITVNGSIVTGVFEWDCRSYPALLQLLRFLKDLINTWS